MKIEKGKNGFWYLLNAENTVVGIYETYVAAERAKAWYMGEWE